VFACIASAGVGLRQTNLTLSFRQTPLGVCLNFCLPELMFLMREKDEGPRPVYPAIKK
jgi:hypothetical protein